MAVTHNDEPETAVLDSTNFDIREAAVTPEADALSVRIRRRILFYLLENPETTEDELVDVIAGWRSTESGMIGATEGEQIAIELRHVHIPLLAGASLVQYDSSTGEIERTDLAEPVRDIVVFAHQYEQAARPER